MSHILIGATLLITSGLALAFGVFAGYAAVCVIIRLMGQRPTRGPVALKQESLAASGD